MKTNSTTKLAHTIMFVFMLLYKSFLPKLFQVRLGWITKGFPKGKIWELVNSTSYRLEVLPDPTSKRQSNEGRK